MSRNGDSRRRSRRIRPSSISYSIRPRRSGVDHHPTTFASDDAKIQYEIERTDPNRAFLYDATAPAAATVLWNAIGGLTSDTQRHDELARWAKLTDSASYQNAHQAVYGAEPALRITQVLPTLHEAVVHAILTALRDYSLENVAGMPIVDEPYHAMQPKVRAGIEQIEKKINVDADGIATYEAEAEDAIVLSRYGAYLVEPGIRYAISLAA